MPEWNKWNKPISESSRVVFEDAETKAKLVEMAKKENTSIKEVIIKLVAKEFKKKG